MSIETDDIYEGLQLFKNYMQVNFPFKQTTYFGTTDPTTGGGHTANIGAFFIRTNADIDTVIDIYYKETSPNTGWKLLTGSAGGGIVAGATTNYTLNFETGVNTTQQMVLQVTPYGDLCHYVLTSLGDPGLDFSQFDFYQNLTPPNKFPATEVLNPEHRPLVTNGFSIPLVGVATNTFTEPRTAGHLHILTDGVLQIVADDLSREDLYLPSETGANADAFNVDANGFVSYTGVWRADPNANEPTLE